MTSVPQSQPSIQDIMALLVGVPFDRELLSLNLLSCSKRPLRTHNESI